MLVVYRCSVPLDPGPPSPVMSQMWAERMRPAGADHHAARSAPFPITITDSTRCSSNRPSVPVSVRPTWHMKKIIRMRRGFHDLDTP